MKLEILSFYKCQMCFVLLRYFIPVSVCVESQLGKPMNSTEVIFEEKMLWKFGDIPLLNRKIFRAMRVTIREHPYIASIRRNIMHYSMATILTKNLFLTAAQPLIDVPIDELSVVVGENYADRGSTLLTVTLVIIHEAFDQSTLSANLAMLRVYEDTLFRCPVKSIPLISANQSLVGYQAFVTGWGRCDRTGKELCLSRSSKYTPGEKFDPMLRTISFLVKNPNSYCERYKQNGVRFQRDMLCLGPAREAEAMASCLAVPGAPLVVDGYLAGLQSWGYGCGYKRDLPLVYTSLQYHREWLLNNIQIMQDIKKEDLTLLFKAKRAYILSKWLNLTRVIRPEPFLQSDKPMEKLKVDIELVKLRGQVLDIRDYLYGGIHHRYKTKLYEKLRETRGSTILQETVTPQLFAFFPTNEPEEETETHPYLFIDHESESDQSYEEN